jgi:hypothetical protein
VPREITFLAGLFERTDWKFAFLGDGMAVGK